MKLSSRRWSMAMAMALGPNVASPGTCMQPERRPLAFTPGVHLPPFRALLSHYLSPAAPHARYPITTPIRPPAFFPSSRRSLNRFCADRLGTCCVGETLKKAATPLAVPARTSHCPTDTQSEVLTIPPPTPQRPPSRPHHRQAVTHTPQPHLAPQFRRRPAAPPKPHRRWNQHVARCKGGPAAT